MKKKVSQQHALLAAILASSPQVPVEITCSQLNIWHPESNRDKPSMDDICLALSFHMVRSANEKDWNIKMTETVNIYAFVDGDRIDVELTGKEFRLFLKEFAQHVGIAKECYTQPRFSYRMQSFIAVASQQVWGYTYSPMQALSTPIRGANPYSMTAKKAPVKVNYAANKGGKK